MRFLSAMNTKKKPQINQKSTPNKSSKFLSQETKNWTQNPMKSSNHSIQCLQKSWKSGGVLSNIRSFEEKGFAIIFATIWEFIYACTSCIPSSAVPCISHIRSQVLNTRSQKMKTQWKVLMILQWSQPLPNHHRCSILESFFFLDLHTYRGLFENCQTCWQAALYSQWFQSCILYYSTVQGMVFSKIPILLV